MAIIFAANELHAFTNIQGVSDVNTGHDTTWTDSAMQISDSDATNYLQTPVWGSAYTEFWVHGRFATASANNWGGSRTPLVLKDPSGTGLLRLITVTTNTLKVQYWDGAAWTDAGAEGAVFTAANKTIDVYVNTATGVKVYIDSVLYLDLSIDLTAEIPSGIQRAKFMGYYSSSGRLALISQIIIADESTISLRYWSKNATGNGANTGWTGDYTAIDEVGLSLTDVISSGSANQIETFTFPARTFTGYGIKTVIVGGYALKGATGPANVQSCLRVGGTNYFSSSKALDFGYKPFQHYFDDNPATSAAWTAADAGSSALEAGVKSIT